MRSELRTNTNWPAWRKICPTRPPGGSIPTDTNGGKGGGHNLGFLFPMVQSLGRKLLCSFGGPARTKRRLGGQNGPFSVAAVTRSGGWAPGCLPSLGVGCFPSLPRPFPFPPLPRSTAKRYTRPGTPLCVGALRPAKRWPPHLPPPFLPGKTRRPNQPVGASLAFCAGHTGLFGLTLAQQKNFPQRVPSPAVAKKLFL